MYILYSVYNTAFLTNELDALLYWETGDMQIFRLFINIREVFEKKKKHKLQGYLKLLVIIDEYEYHK